MLMFGLFFVLYFVKLSVGIGFSVSLSEYTSIDAVLTVNQSQTLFNLMRLSTT